MPSPHYFRTAFSLLAAAVVSTVSAAPVLYYTPAVVSNGLGKANSSQFTAAVTNAFGAGNIVEIPSFANAADFDDGAALFVNARGGSDALSSQEQANLTSFINAGGAVFFIGDHSGWTTWDNSFLSLFGDSFLGWNGVNAALATGAAGNLVPEGTQIALSLPGAIFGGHGEALFTVFAGGLGRRMAARYGPADNAIAFLDTNAFAGSLNPGLYTGISSWLFTTATAYEQSRLNPGNPGGNPVPEHTPFWALAPVWLGLIGWYRRCSRR
jgi:hypothetical protein